MQEKFTWKKEYTIVLILNVAYVLFFSYLMASFT